MNLQGEQTEITMQNVKEKIDELLQLLAPLIKGQDLTIVAGVLLAVADTLISAFGKAEASQQERDQIEFQINQVVALAKQSFNARITDPK